MIKCYRDVDGVCRVDAADVHRLIGSYLEQDIQSDVSACDELTMILDEVVSKRRDGWSRTGNAHTITFHADGVSIANEWDDSLGSAVLPPELFRQCVTAWRQCITADPPSN